MTAVSGVVFTISQIVLRKVCYFLFQPFCKACPTEEEKALRSGKAAYNMFKIIHFTGATVWGYYVLIDQPYFPKFLGGHGDLIHTFDGYPYQTHAYQLKECLLILMGYHVGSLINHGIGARRTDFLEMALHHSVSVFLYGGCYLYNAWEIGGVIALIHDIADITTSMIKVIAETDYKYTTVGIFLFHMGLWAYTRNYGLYVAICKILEAPPDFGIPFNLHMYVFLLSCLLLLHYWWFYLFLKHLWKFIKKGTTENTMDKVQTDVKKV
jgi:hypothetical protein